MIYIKGWMIASLFAVLPIFHKSKILVDMLGQVHKIFGLKTFLIKFHVVKITFCYFMRFLVIKNTLVIDLLFLFHLARYQVEDESSHLDEMPLMMSEEGFENDESDYHTLPRARISQRKRGLEWFICGGWKFLCTRFVTY